MAINLKINHNKLLWQHSEFLSSSLYRNILTKLFAIDDNMHYVGLKSM